jgi:glucuronoarabinoxylan endo-1,4-beta-xylanase
MAHIARFARPGYVRIEATANPTSNVYVTANRGGNSTDVAVNKETSAVSQQFTLTNSTASWLTDVVPAAPSEATRELASR